MALLSVQSKGKEETLSEPTTIAEKLIPYQIQYGFLDKIETLPKEATNSEILHFFDPILQPLMKSGNYVTADVIQLSSQTPQLDELLNRFNKEHWHDEDEVRLIVEGSGIFHIHATDHTVFRIEMFAGDWIVVPKGTLHWFDLCEEKTIRAIRLFQNTTGWTPHYTSSNMEEKHLPLCFGSVAG